MVTSSRQQRAPGAVTAAVRDAARFDRRAVSAGAGLLAAIPVVAVLGGGIIAGKPVWGVTMGAGGMLVGIAWRTQGGRPPLALMATDAAVMATSTFVGCITGSVLGVHLLVLCLWGLMGGLLVGFGNRGGIVGTQAIIAVVVFGRFSEPAPAALGLAALVLAGGLAQVVFLTVIRWPLPLRIQRIAAAAAYRELAALARATDDASALGPATALDEADSSLASPTLFGDATLMTLRTLLSEAYRLRIGLIAVHALLRQLASGTTTDGNGADIAGIARRSLVLTASALEAAARLIEGHDDAEPGLHGCVGLLSEEIDRLDTPEAQPDPEDPIALHLERRLAALSGQVRAIGSLAPVAAAGGGLRSRRPVRRTNHPLQRARADLAQLRANLSLESPAARHALRLAVIVPVASLIARELPLNRSYWLVVAAATVLRPEFGATFTRGTERALGTCLGVGLAGAIAVVIHPAGGLTVAIVGLCAWAGYAVFPASFAVGFGFITALVVFLLNAVSPDTLSTASARLLDTLVGGTIGLLAYALWPTWSQVPAWQSLADLTGAERVYVNGVLLALIDGHRPSEQQMTRLSRPARLARTNAESTVARSLTEPSTRRIDAQRSQGILGAMRRLIQAAHVLRLAAQDDGERPAIAELEPLRAGLDELLRRVEAILRAHPEPTPADVALPDLRRRYRRLAATLRDRDPGGELLTELDELVDAANSLASLAGLESLDAADEMLVAGGE
jgi:uncharacterized membrane protein YccC